MVAVTISTCHNRVRREQEVSSEDRGDNDNIVRRVDVSLGVIT